MITTYETKDGFLFRRGEKNVGRLPYTSLKLQLLLEATGEDIEEIGWLTPEFTAGEVYKPAGKHEIVLGPKRKFTHEVTLHACGNPDFGQYADIAPKKIVRCCGTDEAVKIVKDYQSHYDMGGGNCSLEHGVVWELGAARRKKVGAVSYNGRYQTVAEIKASKAEHEAKYSKIK